MTTRTQSTTQAVDSTVLSPREVEQLVELRIQLEEAARSVRSAGKYRRVQAAVAIDAVIERTSSLVATARGLTMSPQAKLDDTISKLRQSFAEAWQPTVLQDVRELRRARNAAQHDALTPDLARLSTLSASAEHYVVSLVDAQFGVNLKTVTLADAIQDPTWRSEFATAERWLSTGKPSDIDQALSIVGRLLNSAEERWKSFSRPITMQSLHDDKPTRRILRRVEQHLRIEEWLFATHPSEARWVRDVLHSQEGTVDPDEAERVLSYTFSWLTSLEMAIAEWPLSRSRRADVRKRIVGDPGETPRITRILSITEHSPTRSSVRVQLQGVPPADVYDAWSQRLSDSLRDQDDIYWTIHYDGTVEWQFPANDPTLAAQGASALQQALTDSTSLEPPPVPAVPEVTTPDQSALRLMEADFQQDIEQVSQSLPRWVTEISLNATESHNEPFMVVSVSASIDNLPDGLWTLRKEIADYPQVDQCDAAGIDMDKLHIRPVLTAADVVGLLKSVHTSIVAELDIGEERQRQKAGRLAQIDKFVRVQLGWH